jgi:hypothetical protein
LRTLIDFYDRNVTANMMAVLSYQPEKVIYLYDKQFEKKADVHHLFKGCQAHLPQLVMEKYPVDAGSMEEISQVLGKILEGSDEFAIDLTGGPELMLICGYSQGMERGLPMYHLNMGSGSMAEIRHPEDSYPLHSLNLDDYIFVSGAYLMGYSKQAPEPAWYRQTMGMCRAVLRNSAEWKQTCLYLQAGMGRQGGLQFDAPYPLINKNKQTLEPSEKLLRDAARFGFIRDLTFGRKSVSFRFPSQSARQTLLTFGSWLELFVYIHASQIPAFEDVRCGAILDWNAYDGVEILGNEIDVVLMKSSIPVFISCKQAEPDADAVNELMVIQSRLGGSYGKSILITLADTKKMNTPMNRRAKELGIMVMDKTDILAADFRNRLKNLIMEAVPF